MTEAKILIDIEIGTHRIRVTREEAKSLYDGLKAMFGVEMSIQPLQPPPYVPNVPYPLPWQPTIITTTDKTSTGNIPHFLGTNWN